MYVNMIAKTEVKILYLDYKTLMDLVNKHGQVGQKIKDAKAKELQSQRIANFTTRVLIA